MPSAEDDEQEAEARQQLEKLVALREDSAHNIQSLLQKALK